MSAKVSASLEALLVFLLTAVYFGFYSTATVHHSGRFFQAAVIVGAIAFFVCGHYAFGPSHESWGTDTITGSLLLFCMFAVGASIPLTLFLYPAVKNISDATARSQLGERLKQIGVAMHTYHDKHKRLPAAAIYSADGQPLLSWRVVLLPYLGHDDLYRQFRLDEPWDSAHNLALAAEMPKVYKLPAFFDDRRVPNATYFQVFVGPGAAFEGKVGVSLFDFPDGPSNTVMVTLAEEPVVWTKPADLAFPPKGPLPKPRAFYRGDWYFVLFADGSSSQVDASITDGELRAAITRNDGKPRPEVWNR
jgi:hypothetical protein